MLFLGISDQGPDPAAALVDDRGVVAAIEERKLSRTPATARLPRQAVSYCLREAGASGRDLTATAVAGRHVAGPRAPERLAAVEELVGSQSVDALEHHLCHAASAFYPSDADRALVVTLDHSGDGWSGLIALGEGSELRVLKSIRFPESFGLVYSDVTRRLGFRARADEHKTQWLSTRGTTDLVPAFRTLFTRQDDGLPSLNREFLSREPGHGWALSPGFYASLGLGENGEPPRDEAQAAAVACGVQTLVEEQVLALVEHFRQATGTTALCVAGGLFLNVLLVRALEDRSGFEEVFVQPAAGNPGTALGAAYLARVAANPAAARQPLRHLYLGPGAVSGDIKAVLDNCKVVYRYLSDADVTSNVVDLLGVGKSVAWHQGRIELGHRALGHRSILTSPFAPFVAENLNEFIKHREAFHPFVLSIPAEEASRYFDATPSCRFSCSTPPIKDGVDAFDALAFGERRVRLHTVERDTNPRLWTLLHAFGRTAPAPVLVNTSFNLFGEALVSAPRDAVRTFYCSGIDALAMGNFLLVK